MFHIFIKKNYFKLMLECSNEVSSILLNGLGGGLPIPLTLNMKYTFDSLIWIRHF